jgi:hypothetical protein
MLVFDFSSDSVFGMGVGPFDKLRTGCWALRQAQDKLDYGLWIMNYGLVSSHHKSMILPEL